MATLVRAIGKVRHCTVCPSSGGLHMTYYIISFERTIWCEKAFVHTTNCMHITVADPGNRKGGSKTDILGVTPTYDILRH